MRYAFVSAFLLVVAWCMPVRTFGADGGKASLLPVPPAEKRAAAERVVREIFAADLAKRSPGDQAATAKKLLAEAEKERETPARYVLIDDARELALSAGETALAWRASDALAGAYDVDG